MAQGSRAVAVAAIAALWIAFATSHIALSSQALRPRLVARLGAPGFQGIYSLVALGLFVPLCWVYFTNQHAGAHLWYFGHIAVLRWLGYAAMALAFAIFVGGLLTPSPAGMIPTRGEVRGVLRITRHPLFMAAGLFGLLHLAIANVNAAEFAFFAGFPLFALVGCRHQDARRRAESPEYAAFCGRTPFLPFAGAGSLGGLLEMPLAVALGSALALGLRIVHADWFGGVDWLGFGG
jgi:uncharacterized membrane protein